MESEDLGRVRHVVPDGAAQHTLGSELLAAGELVVAKVDGGAQGDQGDDRRDAVAHLARRLGDDVSGAVEMLRNGGYGVGPEGVRQPALEQCASGRVLQLAMKTLRLGMALQTARHTELHSGVGAFRGALELSTELSAWLGADEADVLEAERRLGRDRHEFGFFGGQRYRSTPSSALVCLTNTKRLPSCEESTGPMVSTWTRPPKVVARSGSVLDVVGASRAWRHGRLRSRVDPQADG